MPHYGSNFIDLIRIESLEELQASASGRTSGPVDSMSQEELPGSRAREARHVEHRVIRHRQPVQGQHAEHRGERREENRHLEGHRNELGQLLNGLPPTLIGIGDRRHPVLQAESG